VDDLSLLSASPSMHIPVSSNGISSLRRITTTATMRPKRDQLLVLSRRRTDEQNSLDCSVAIHSVG
jgi:hypothetical protein